MTEWESWFLQKDDDGRDVPDPTEPYYLTAYLGSGLAIHEPLCLQAWGCDSRRLCTLYEGNVHPFELGRIAARTAKVYTSPAGLPTVDPMSRGGYVDQFLEGLEVEKFRGAVSHEKWISRNNVESQRLGHSELKPTIDNILGAIQRAIAAKDCEVQSEVVIRAMMLASVDEDGELQTGPGRKIGHVICAGRALHALNQRGKSQRRSAAYEANPVLRLRDQARKAAMRTDAGPVEDWGS